MSDSHALVVDKWNADRSERGLPLLRLDSTMYTGRYAYFAECQTVGGSPDGNPHLSFSSTYTADLFYVRNTLVRAGYAA